MSEQDVQLGHLDNLSDDELSQLDLENLLEQKSEDTEVQDTSNDEVNPETEEATEELSDDVSEQGDNEEPEKEIDYKAFYEKLNQPFKANGRDLQIRSPEEAIQLMQMGANYHKKMESLKPKTKVLKVLEKHDLLDEQKLAYLIDLNNKNPEAVAKLVQESGIDALDLEDKVNPNYSPHIPTVSDTELELDSVLDELRDSPSYSRTLDIAGNQWDISSRTEIASNPHILRGLNEHVYLGIYDIINTEVDRQRMLGNLKGMTDIQAYKAVGDYLNNQGAFNYLNQENNYTQQSNQVNEQINERRKAAATPNASATKETTLNIDPLKMSDEEILRLVNQIH